MARTLLRVAAATLAALALGVPSALAEGLGGSAGAGARFPDRTLVLSAPAGVPVAVPTIYVAENGQPVYNLSARPLANAAAGDFGLVLVLDQGPGMSGGLMSQAMIGARALSNVSTGKQELGMITYDSNPALALPLTSNRLTIYRALSQTPATGPQSRLLPALTLALSQLSAAKIADGVVVLVSTGADSGEGSLTPQAVAGAARAQHVKLFTVGVGSGGSNSSVLGQLAKLTGGRYVSVASNQLPQTLTALNSRLTRGYLLRYRSIVAAGQRVDVKVWVKGVSEPLKVSYFAPSPPSPLAPNSSTPSGGPSPAPAAAAGSGATSTSPLAKTSTGSSPNTKSSPLAKTAGARGAKSGSGSGATTNPYVALAMSAPILKHTESVQVLSPRPAFAIQVGSWSPPRQGKSFLTSGTGALALAGGIALLIGLAVVMLVGFNPARRAVKRRVEDFIGAARAPEEETGEPRSGAFSKLLTRMRWWPRFCEQVQTARIRRTPIELVRRTALVALGVAVIVVLVSGSALFGFAVFLVAPFCLKAWVTRGARRQRRVFAEQLPSTVQDLAGAMRSGRSFVGAISVVAQTAAEPMRGEFERALRDEQLGLPLEEAVLGVAERMKAKDMDQIALIAALNRNSGSNVAESLDRVAESARERADLGREMRALTGQARMSSFVLTGLPPLLLVALTVIAPRYSWPLFHTTGGIFLLLFGTGLVISGWMVMKRIVNPEP